MAEINNEVEALDNFCILDIQDLNCKDPIRKQELHQQFLDFTDEIVNKIGNKKFVEIQYSLEMNALWHANLDMFKGLDRLKEKDAAKQALKEKFFP